MKTLWRYGKAQVSFSWLLPPMWLIALLAWQFYKHSPVRGGGHQATDLYGIFEFYLPLASTFYLAGLPAFDRDEGAAETLLTYPRWPCARLLLAAAPRCLAWLVMCAGAIAVAYGWYYPVSPLELAAIIAAPAVALSGAALVGTAVTHNQAGGIIVSAVWWVLDAAVPGRPNVQFYLFRVTAPLGPAVIGPAVQTLHLYLLGTALWVLALWLAERRSWWLR